MKNVLLLIKSTGRPERFNEAIRVAAGLSQHPELRVSLKLPLPIPASVSSEYFDTFAEKGHRLYADPQWLPLLPPSLKKLHQDPTKGLPTADFDLFVPF